MCLDKEQTLRQMEVFADWLKNHEEFDPPVNEIVGLANNLIGVVFTKEVIGPYGDMMVVADEVNLDALAHSTVVIGR